MVKAFRGTGGAREQRKHMRRAGTVDKASICRSSSALEAHVIWPIDEIPIPKPWSLLCISSLIHLREEQSFGGSRHRGGDFCTHNSWSVAADDDEEDG